MSKKDVKGSYVSMHSSGFRDFLLKPELLKAIGDCGFEHPSEGFTSSRSLPLTCSYSLPFSVQHECIPQAILGQDVICQAKSGMGKTAVFVLSTLQQVTPVDGEVSVLVVCHARELAFQISREFERFAKYLDPAVKTLVFYGGTSIEADQKKLAATPPVCPPPAPFVLPSIRVSSTLSSAPLGVFLR